MFCYCIDIQSAFKMYDLKIISAIKDHLLKNNQTLSVAESVTAGHLQAALSVADGATDFFQGGITTYNLGQKSRHLGIDPIHGLKCNCVSDITARQMALGSLSLFSSNWAIAITGYAAPVPELGVSELFAYYAIAFDGDIVLSKKIVTRKEGVQQVQLFYTDSVLKAFKECFNPVVTSIV
jgi:nicotinamide-nucleotide amidase